MQIRIRHETQYYFDGPVLLEPHIVRLWPRADPTQHILSYRIQISPEPIGRGFYLDAQGNSVLRVWFSGMTDHLSILAAGDVETLRNNPFDFLILPEATRLPLRWTERMGPTLLPFLSVDASEEMAPVRELARAVAREVDQEILPFLGAVNQRIYQSVRVIRRYEGAPLPPYETLVRGVGACRDLAMLFIEICRQMGLPARFVSGYAAGVDPIEDAHLHAWAEVCLPGGGWRGYDPTLGLAVADQHIALAAGTPPENTLPVEGSFRGTGRSATMEIDLRIESFDAEREAQSLAG